LAEFGKSSAILVETTKKETRMRRTILTLLTLSIWLAQAPFASAESAADVIDRMVEAENANYDGVDNIFQRTRVMGHSAPEYFERDGQRMRLVPLPELLAREQPNEMSDATPMQLEEAATVLREQSVRADAALQEEIAKSGLGGNAGMATMIGMASNPEEEWLTSSPGGMMNLYATFLEGAADSKRQMAMEKAAEPGEAAVRQQMLDDVKTQTQIIGRHTEDGIDVIELGADDLDVLQKSPEGSFLMQSVRILVDADRYLPVRFKIDGILTQGAESRPMSIERIDSQFTNPPGCSKLYKPQRSTMKMAGILTDQQRAEIAEAEIQLQELDQQLASMPAAQKEMMMKMMGPQIEMARNLAAGGGVEIVSDIVELRCNAAPPTSEELARKFYQAIEPARK